MTSVADNQPVVECRGLGKAYGGIDVLQDASISFRPGSVHGILGKNGAGKSTLVGLIAGSIQPTAGSVELDGVDVTDQTLAQRLTSGIKLLDQHAQVIPGLTVAENLLLPEYPRRRGGLFDRKRLNRLAADALERFGVDIPVDVEAGSLTMADQRRLNITRALLGKSRLVMLDEPTTALNHRERRSLFEWIDRLRGEGRAIAFISHYSQEIREICDDYTVLRDGRVVASGSDVRGMTPGALSELVTGKRVQTERRTSATREQVALQLRSLRPTGMGPVSLEVHAGEVVGLTGPGARDVARSLVGLEHAEGDVEVSGRKLDRSSVRDAAAGGAVYLTDDRIGEGLVPTLSVIENLHLASLPRTRLRLVDRSAMSESFKRRREELALACRRAKQPVSELSGGNQQKVLLGRLLRLSPSVLVLHEPTAGVDVGAKADVYALIDDYARRGGAVVLIAYDLDELVQLSDRIAVVSSRGPLEWYAGADLTVDDIHHALEAAS